MKQISRIAITPQGLNYQAMLQDEMKAQQQQQRKQQQARNTIEQDVIQQYQDAKKQDESPLKRFIKQQGSQEKIYDKKGQPEGKFEIKLRSNSEWAEEFKTHLQNESSRRGLSVAQIATEDVEKRQISRLLLRSSQAMRRMVNSKQQLYNLQIKNEMHDYQFHQTFWGDNNNCNDASTQTQTKKKYFNAQSKSASNKQQCNFNFNQETQNETFSSIMRTFTGIGRETQTNINNKATNAIPSYQKVSKSVVCKDQDNDNKQQLKDNHDLVKIAKMQREERIEKILERMIQKKNQEAELLTSLEQRLEQKTKKWTSDTVLEDPFFGIIFDESKTPLGQLNVQQRLGKARYQSRCKEKMITQYVRQYWHALHVPVKNRGLVHSLHHMNAHKKIYQQTQYDFIKNQQKDYTTTIVPIAQEMKREDEGQQQNLLNLKKNIIQKGKNNHEQHLQQIKSQQQKQRTKKVQVNAQKSKINTMKLSQNIIKLIKSASFVTNEVVDQRLSMNLEHMRKQEFLKEQRMQASLLQQQPSLSPSTRIHTNDFN